MIAGFADQQHYALPSLGLFLEQTDRIIDGVQDLRPFVPRLQIGQVVGNQTFIFGEISCQLDLAVELDDRNPRRSEGEQRAKHRLQALHSRELGIGPPPFLNRYD